MPTLRFSRDRRGYESTYLLHSSRRRTGPDQPQLLYWFRSPPHVKVGRAAFDEDAIRVLEEQHPDVEFDWDRILTTKPPAAPESRDPREARLARRPERRPAKESRRDMAVSAPYQPSAAPPAAPEPPERAPVEVASPPPVAAPSVPGTVVKDVDGERDSTSSTVPGAVTRRFVRVFDAPAIAIAPAVPQHHASAPAVVERLLGAEQLTVLRARHAEILARISARGGDPARVEALREQAASVDPDGWVTESDVTAGLAALDATLLELHRIVGRRRRRRRRRRDTGSIQPPMSGAPDNPAGAEDAESDDPEPDGPDDGPGNE